MVFAFGTSTSASSQRYSSLSLIILMISNPSVMNMKLFSSPSPKRTDFFTNFLGQVCNSLVTLITIRRTPMPKFSWGCPILNTKKISSLRLWLTNSVKFYSSFVMSHGGGQSSRGHSISDDVFHQLLSGTLSWMVSNYALFSLSASNACSHLNNDNAAINMNRLIC